MTLHPHERRHLKKHGTVRAIRKLNDETSCVQLDHDCGKTVVKEISKIHIDNLEEWIKVSDQMRLFYDKTVHFEGIRPGEMCFIFLVKTHKEAGVSK